MAKRKKFNFGLYLAVTVAGFYFFRRMKMKAGKTAVPTTLSNQVSSIYTGGH
jgi:hypothetical protein